MSFNLHFPGLISLVKDTPYFCEVPNSALNQQSSYAYVEKLAGITNPLSLQTDVIYPNAAKAIIESVDPEASRQPLATGCRGNMIDNHFPLESITPFALPLVMYPSKTDGKQHHEMDICALPVLNWEEYIQDVRHCTGMAAKRQNEVIGRHGRRSKAEQVPSPSDAVGEGVDYSPGSEEYILPDTPEELETPESAIPEIPGSVISDEPLTRKRHPLPRKNVRKAGTVYSKAFKDMLMADSSGVAIKAEELPKERWKRMSMRPKTTVKLDVPATLQYVVSEREKNKLPKIATDKIKNVPGFRLEATWNYLYGGFNGACCFLKTSSNFNIFVGKGALLRSIRLGEASKSLMLPYSVESIWDEDKDLLPFQLNFSDPFNDVIYQILPNTPKAELVAVRRGRAIQIYSVEEPTPYILESIHNIRYGTDEYHSSKRSHYVNDPLLLGLDWNPISWSELVTIGENGVVRFCDIGNGVTKDSFKVPREPTYRQSHRPKGYPLMKLNEAAGVSYANSSDIFYAWSNSVVYRGDRRDPSVSRSHLAPILDTRNHVQMRATSSQNYFHDAEEKVNDFVSCLRKSQTEPYYYVGTSSKIYLMDQRVPSHPVFKVNHGLQSPLAYMEVISEDNIETVIGASQRLPETVCMITNTGHTLCTERADCKSRNPILHCYPYHLYNSRSNFDYAIKQGFDFPFPEDFQTIKNHHYAWTTGLAVHLRKGLWNSSRPKGILIATCNNFGDVFYQEWGQKPIPPHLKTGINDFKFTNYFNEWRNAMKPKATTFDPAKSSKNKYNPVDCSILIEPLTYQLRRLARVRDYPFNPFKAHDQQYKSNLKTVIPVPELTRKLQAYKDSKVAGMLNVWRRDDIRKSVPTSEQSQVDATDEIIIKEEPIEDGSISWSSIRTITVEGSVAESEIDAAQERQQLSNIEREVCNTINNSDSSDNELLERLHSGVELDPELFETSNQTPPEWFSMQRLHASMIGEGDQTQFGMPEADYHSQPLFPSQDQDMFSGEPFPSTSSQARASSSRTQNKPRSSKKKAGFL